MGGTTILLISGNIKISSVQFSHSVMSNSLRPHELQQARHPVDHQLLEFTQTNVHRVGDAIQPSHPLLFPCPPAPSITPSIRVFSNESTLHVRWPKYWSCSFSIVPSKEIPGLISFRMDRLDLLAVHGVAKSRTRLSDFTFTFTFKTVKKPGMLITI